MSHAHQIEEAKDALKKLETSLMDFDPESGEFLALAVEEMADTSCAIEALLWSLEHET